MFEHDAFYTHRVHTLHINTILGWQSQTGSSEEFWILCETGGRAGKSDTYSDWMIALLLGRV